MQNGRVKTGLCCDECNCWICLPAAWPFSYNTYFRDEAKILNSTDFG